MQILKESMTNDEKIAIIKDDVKNFSLAFKYEDVEKMQIFYERIKNLMED